MQSSIARTSRGGSGTILGSEIEPFSVVVVDESGIEIHREPVHPDTSDTSIL